MFAKSSMIQSSMLNTDFIKRLIITLKENVIVCYDSLLWYGLETYTGTFFVFDEILNNESHLDHVKEEDNFNLFEIFDDDSDIIYYESNMYRAQYQQIYERDVYSMLDFLGDLGGVSGIFITMFGLICFPYAEYAYNLKMTKNLFKARTTDRHLLVNKHNDKSCKN